MRIRRLHLIPLFVCFVAIAHGAFADALIPEPPLLTVAAMRAFPPDESRRGEIVKIRGVITYSAPEDDLLFVQDDTGGCFASPPKDAPPPGSLVEIVGRISAGLFAPRLDSLESNGSGAGVHLTVLSPELSPLPAPRLLEGRDLSASALLYRRVEISGVVRRVLRTEDRVNVELTSLAGSLTGILRNADVSAATGFPDESWLGGVIRLRGVATARFDSDHGQTGLDVLCAALSDLSLIQGGISSFEELPARTVASLNQFSIETGPRARVRGTVNLHEPGRGLFLSDHTGALWVRCPQSTLIAPGALVDAVGFPVAEEGRSVLDDAVCVVRTVVPRPEAKDVDASAALNGGYYGQLVRVQGFVVDRFFSPGNNTMALQSGDVMFDARLLRDPADQEVLLPSRGSRVAIVGVCVNRAGGSTSSEVGGGQFQPVSFQLLVDSLTDVRVLQSPSWWTTDRIMRLLAFVAAALLIALAAVVTLVFRTRRQTALLRESEARAAVHEERQRIARELHDTLEQELTGISLTLDAANDTLATSPETAAAALERARQFLRHTRHEARRSIWDLRTVALEQGNLAIALREMIGHFPSPPSITVNLEGEPVKLPGPLENSLLRIGTEAVTNAIKHAQADTITVTLSYLGATVELTVQDDGHGFPANGTAPMAPGHFGLLGMRERAVQCKATLELASTAETGTRICVRVPLQPTLSNRQPPTPYE